MDERTDQGPRGLMSKMETIGPVGSNGDKRWRQVGARLRHDNIGWQLVVEVNQQQRHHILEMAG